MKRPKTRGEKRRAMRRNLLQHLLLDRLADVVPDPMEELLGFRVLLRGFTDD
jgi:hypothetical protein